MLIELFKWLLSLWSLSFDDKESVDEVDDKVFISEEDGMPDVEVDYSGVFKKDEDEEKSDDKSSDKSGDSDEDESDETDEQEEEEEDEEETDEEDEESEEEEEKENEESTDEEDEEDNELGEEETEEEEDPEEASNFKKRFQDTQRALHRTKNEKSSVEKENAELKARLEKLEKKVSGNEKPDKEEELTIENIDPKVLAQAMQKNPVNTMRWIADQQVKVSQRQAQKSQASQQAETERQKAREEAENLAFTQYPVLDEVLSLDADKLKDLQKKEPVKYKFAKKVTEYYQKNLDRNDDEALLNAANRVYREMGSKVMEQLIKETRDSAKREMTHKKRVLAKVKVSSSKKKGANSSSGFKSLSAEEFEKLSPSEQDKYMEASVNDKLSKK